MSERKESLATFTLAKKSSRIDKVCIQCGLEFSVIRCREHSAKFCSSACFFKSDSFHKWAPGKAPKNFGNKFAAGQIPWNKGLDKNISEVLKNAGVKIARKKLGVKSPKTKVRCDKGKPGQIENRRRGDKHPLWKGGVSTESRKERIKFRRTMQHLIFQRDNYKCTGCGDGGNLHADHIKSWAEFPEFRFDISNCRTLCERCHYEVTFGRPMSENAKGWGHNMISLYKQQA